MTSRRYKRVRASTTPALDYFNLAVLAHGYTLFAGWPKGLIDDRSEVLPDAALQFVKRYGLSAIRQACIAEGIKKPGERLWCEDLSDQPEVVE